MSISVNIDSAILYIKDILLSGCKLKARKRDDYSYFLSIGKDGLWQAERTETQVAKDQLMQEKIQARLDFEDEMWQDEVARGQQYLNELQSAY